MSDKVVEHVIVRPWQYSVSLDINAKGWVQPSVHVYGDEKDVWVKATCLLDETIDELKTMNFKVATDIKEKEPMRSNGE